MDLVPNPMVAFSFSASLQNSYHLVQSGAHRHRFRHHAASYPFPSPQIICNAGCTSRSECADGITNAFLLQDSP
jgi:hypothetical protein